MSIPTFQSLNVTARRVLIRADLDVDQDMTRLELLLPTLKWVQAHGASQIVLIGHKGRPEGEVNMEFTLEPYLQFFKDNFSKEAAFIKHYPRAEMFEMYDAYSLVKSPLILLENLRFYKDEETNEPQFAEELSYFGEVYINDAFASSHRAHASVSALPGIYKARNAGCGIGVQFAHEIENLSKLFTEPARPFIFVISGVKKDKLDFVEDFKKLADKVLIGGRLPEFLPEDNRDPKLIVARLNPDKEDITLHSVEQFEEVIASAKTIFVSGPVGKYEEEGHLLGTKRVFEAIAKSSALKIAGGGDTTAAIKALGITQSFDWISTGGGASLEFLAKKTLPGIEALKG